MQEQSYEWGEEERDEVNLFKDYPLYNRLRDNNNTLIKDV